MSIEVALSALADTVARYRFAYLLTVGELGPPHAVAVTPRVDSGVLEVSGTGRRTRENVQTRPDVTLVWPPTSAETFSLIVDGQAAVRGEALRITPLRAVLHRPAP